jgi:two-component system LytT family response regulator
MRRTLAALLADLGEGFVRTHRSAAVAVVQVSAVLAGEHGDAEVLLRSGARVPCSRAQRAALQAALQAGALPPKA